MTVNLSWIITHIFTDLLVGAALILASLILILSLLLVKVIKCYTEKPMAVATEPVKAQSPSFWLKLLQLKPLDQEDELLMEHQFDGIAELDNPTPTWFMVLFYSTIVFAIGYMVNYHVLSYGQLQDAEYVAEIEQAREDKLKFLANPANAVNAVNENNVVQTEDVAVLKSGASLFANRCTPCHGEKAEGGVGPNLTDEYWLHGGSVKDVFKTIRYGVPDKGMIAWEKSLSSAQISDLTNYILSLKGSNPANAKPPQGKID